MTKPQHHRGYIILRHRTKPLVHTAYLSWYMSMPNWKRDKFHKNWEVVLICSG